MSAFDYSLQKCQVAHTCARSYTNTNRDVSPGSVCVSELQLNFDEVLSTRKSGMNLTFIKRSKISKGKDSVNKRSTERCSLKVHSMGRAL